MLQNLLRNFTKIFEWSSHTYSPLLLSLYSNFQGEGRVSPLSFVISLPRQISSIPSARLFACISVWEKDTNKANHFLLLNYFLQIICRHAFTQVVTITQLKSIFYRFDSGRMLWDRFGKKEEEKREERKKKEKNIQCFMVLIKLSCFFKNYINIYIFEIVFLILIYDY